MEGLKQSEPSAGTAWKRRDVLWDWKTLGVTADVDLTGFYQLYGDF